MVLSRIHNESAYSLLTHSHYYLWYYLCICTWYSAINAPGISLNTSDYPECNFCLCNASLLLNKTHAGIDEHCVIHVHIRC